MGAWVKEALLGAAVVGGCALVILGAWFPLDNRWAKHLARRKAVQDAVLRAEVEAEQTTNARADREAAHYNTLPAGRPDQLPHWADLVNEPVPAPTVSRWDLNDADVERAFARIAAHYVEAA